MTYYGRRKVVAALRSHDRDVTMPWRALKPTRTPSNHGPVVVIQRGSKRLVLYRGTRARGDERRGVVRGRDRDGRLPDAHRQLPHRDEAAESLVVPARRRLGAGASPVPPGPGNPLGTRWMGLNVGAVGIHGTPDAASIGYSASHGCIRMRISDAEWLFERVRVGTPVFIRSA